jgi:putative DNA primase/helicase
VNCLDAALAYAGKDWPVFPLHRMVTSVDLEAECSCGRRCSSPGKHPRTPNGVKDATTDAEVIRMWKTWPESNVAIATGPTSGLYVVDIEADGRAAYAEARGTHTDSTRAVVITGGGGRHHYYALPVDDVLDEPLHLPNTHWKVARKVDTRGTGGYVVAPPSNHHSGGAYQWLDVEASHAAQEARYAPQPGIPYALPVWVREAVTPRLATPTAPPVIRFESTAYGMGVLRHALDRVARAAEGERNSTLNLEAFALGQWIGGGEVDPRGVAEALEAACPDPDREKTQATIRRALYDGAQHPRNHQEA